MPKASVLQASFTSGEVSPLYYGQADNPRYKKGLQTGQNILPILQGPIVRRPGTKFCAQAKVTGTAPILVPFQFSETQAYMLEFGDQYIRFYANNGQMVTSGASFMIQVSTDAGVYLGFKGFASRANTQLQAGERFLLSSAAIGSGSILEIGSPYLAADLSGIKWAQNADTLYIVHPKYPVYKLQRQAQTFWKLIPVAFQDGPYLPLNSYQTYGDSANISLNILSVVPNSGWAIRTVGVGIAGAIADPGGSGQIQITTTAVHGFLTGQNIFISGVTGTTESNNWDSVFNPGPVPKSFWPIQVTSTTTFLLQGSTFVNAYAGGGTAYPALFSADVVAVRAGSPMPDAGRTLAFIDAGVRYWGYIVPIIENAAVVTISSPTAVAVGVNPTAWQLGVYSIGYGFPTSACFHQNRLCFAGPGVAPQEVDGSTVGQYENFAPSDPLTLQVSDSNAFSFQLNSADANVIQWLASTAQGLLAGTYVAEWVLTPSSAGEALTAKNFNAQMSSFYGSAPTRPVQLGNGTLYIQRAFRKIREMSFFFQAGTFRSIEMTELSEHITVPRILGLAVTKETQPLIWGVRSDGSLVSMIYNRDDLSLIAGWTRHPLGGQSDSAGTIPIVSSIASIPSPDISFDQLWLVVQRYINGATVYYVEYMTKIFDDDFLQEDAFQVDCGGTFFNPVPIGSISTASPAQVVVSAPSASFAGYANGDRIRFFGVVGLNRSTTDANGNVTITNLVNEQQFVVSGVVNLVAFGITTSTFNLHDFSGNNVSSIPFGAYVSGGFTAKMVTTISGLTWLHGETLSVLADGGIHPPVVVSNAGQVTLQFAAAKVQLGYGFKSQAKLLRADAGSPDGSSIGKTRRTTRIAVQMHRTGDLAVGTTFDNLIPVELGQADVDDADQPMPLFSGMIREGLESAYDFESQPCMQMSSALPGCIQSVTSFMEEFDV